jgi:hypothetical protein
VNLLELAQRLHRELGRAGSGPTSVTTANRSDRSLFDWVSDAWNDIQTETYGWRWMLKSADCGVTGASQTYTGADFGLADHGRFRPETDDYTVRAFDPANPANVWRMKFVPYDRFVRQCLDIPPAAAAPQLWSITPDNKLAIAPQPDGAYTLKVGYVSSPTVLAADEDAPNMPSEYHMAVVWKAMVDGGMYEASQEALARAATHWDSIESKLLIDQGEQITITARPL